MEQPEVPMPLAKGFLRLAPPHLLGPMLEALMRKIEERHPRLFANLERLDPALVSFEVLDLPHVFSLRFGGGKACLRVVPEGDSEKPDAVIRGRLSSLLDMLEGRTDGDTLFFARDITVTGDSSVVVGLRNTLDREALNVMDEVLSFCGPFAKPAGMGLSILERVGKHVRNRIEVFHENLHAAQKEAKAK